MSLEKPIVFSPDEMVSKVVSKMYRSRKHNALIMEGNELVGILTARDLAKRKINEPEKTAIKKFIRSANPLLPGHNTEDVMNSILVNDFKAVPVKDGKGNIFFVTKLEVLNQMKNDKSFKNKNASDVMVSPYCVDSSDSIATAMSIIRQVNISRLPVVDNENKILGLIDTVDLLKAEIEMSSVTVGDRSGESINLRNVLASSLMQGNVARAQTSTPLSKIISTMLSKKTETVLIEKNGKLVGLITPKMILKLIGKKLSGIYVRISGLQKEEAYIKSLVDEQVRNEIRKLGKILSIEFLVMHIDRHNKTGNRVKYSVKSTLATQKGTFYANDFAWDITKAIRGVLSKFEKEVLKRKENGV
jgi:CBS domain-containing protein/ribosome-associated translation inhibitor RaiA